MAAVIICTQCSHELTEHCQHCGWLCCINARCHVRFYDVARGVRSMRDGSVEQLGAPG